MKKLAQLVSVIGLAAMLVSSAFAGSATYSSTSSSQYWNVSLPSAGQFASTVTASNVPANGSTYAIAFVLNQSTNPTTQLYFVQAQGSGTRSASANASAGNYTIVHYCGGVGSSSTTTVTW